MAVQRRRRNPSGTAASRGGRANEAGSLYRSGVAAYLAAHGLVGRGVEAAGYAEGGPAPVMLSFETGDAVDDIRCGLADGTVLWLQAKRACGADAHLEATAAQWVGQVASMHEGDKIGLATAEPRGAVRDLGAALDRRRRSPQVAGPFRPSETSALDALRDRLPAGTPQQTADQVMDVAIVMALAASSATDEGFRSVAYLLDGTVVPAGSGTAAISALQRAFQQQAAVGTGSSLDDWLKILADAGLAVYPDAGGPAGPRRRAELDAVAAHRARLAGRDGILEFSLLADDLLPMTFEPLADLLYLEVPRRDLRDAELLGTARRWTRMLLTGLPGMGKSTALEQVAARWAADASAPVPVLVQLRDIARRHPRRATDITLPVLIEVATAGAPEQERMSLRRALEQAVASGDAVLLLDGLDECQDRRAVVADGLAAVAGSLPDCTGIVLATRDSGLAAAGKLKMSEARLTYPPRLDLVLARLLDHIADCRVPEADREQWVGQHQQQLDEIRGSHPDLWRIPLFAILLTLLIARPAPAPLPAGRARLLAEAVRDTVERWELARLSETSPGPGMRTEQLLDGYGEIAHVLIGEPGGCPTDIVNRHLEAMLAERWGLAPGKARAQADDVMAFWDEHAGVFVASQATGDIEPRSRVFAEAGEAMWVARQAPAIRRDWFSAALTDDDRREQAVLAAGLSADVASELIEAASQAADPATRSRGLLWAADATTEGADPAAETLAALIDALAQAASSPAAPATKLPGDMPELDDSVPSPGWPYAMRIAMLPLPGALRQRRDRVLAGRELNEDERPLAAALAALADAGTDARDALEPVQQTAVHRLLARPLPESALLPGHLQAAERAARYARQLGHDAVAAIYRIAGRGYLRDYKRIQSLLVTLGFSDPEPLRLSVRTTRFVAEELDLWEDWEPFFAAAASLETPRALTAPERWRYPDLATLDDLLGTENVTLTAIKHAFTTDQVLLPECLRAAARAAGLDLSAISAEAAVVLDQWPAGNRDVINVMFAPPPSLLPAFDSARLDDRDKDVLLDALGATSDWLAGIARALLLPAHDPMTGQRAADLIPNVPPSRREDVAIVAVANDPSPPDAAARLLGDVDPLVRAGAAAAAQMLANSGDAGTWTPVLTRAREDGDLTVRMAVGTDEATAGTAAAWTCRNCGQINDVDAGRCSQCNKDTRPGESWA